MSDKTYSLLWILMAAIALYFEWPAVSSCTGIIVAAIYSKSHEIKELIIYGYYFDNDPEERD